MLLFKKKHGNKFITSLFCALLLLVHQTTYASHPEPRAEVTVIWKGGPDLIVPFFIPPLLETKAGNPIYINVITANIGITEAIPSVTRFYISPNETIDPATDYVLGEYSVKNLIAEEFLENKQFSFTVPDNFSEGRYYLAACADAENVVAELSESNNCSFAKLNHIGGATVPVFRNPNNPPICDSAVPNIDSIWPPNHKLVDITISGITDPENDPISIQVISIHQDEAVNELADGNSEPDGYGIGTDIAKVRAERSGIGNGRVYSITFKASDDKGASCSTVMTVGVPHDKKDTAVLDSDKNFDSTKAE